MEKKFPALRIKLEEGQPFITGNEMDNWQSSNELDGTNPNNLI